MAESTLPHDPTGVSETDRNRAVVALLVFADHFEDVSEELQSEILDSAQRVALHFGIDITSVAPAVREILQQYPRLDDLEG